MNEKLLVETAVLAGEIMLTSGAETYRVEDTMNRMLALMPEAQPHAFVLPTGIFATLERPAGESISVLRRIEERSMNLYRITEANRISRKLCNGKMETKEAWDALKSIGSGDYPALVTHLAYSGVAASFVMLLGGNMPAMLCAAICSILMAVFQQIGHNLHMHTFFRDAVSTAACVTGAILYNRILGLSLNMDLVIIGLIMPLVPGAAITNAIRDTLHGDYVSGTARVVEAFIKAFSIAAGVGAAMALMGGI